MASIRPLAACGAALLLHLAACSQADRSGSPPGDGDMARSDSAAPDIGVTAAPGVAFSYHYDFALAANGIAAVQERHAAACEALGLDKCRITGLTFERYEDEDVSATLQLALAPDVARRFGKDAIASVVAAKGTLRAMRIDGVDRTDAIDRSQSVEAEARTERARLEAELQRTDLTPDARAALRDRLAVQDQRLRAAQATGDDARASRASTPMQLSYMTDGSPPAFRLGETAWRALGFAGLLLNGLLQLLIVLVTIAVPLGLLALIAAHGRKLLRRLWRRLAPDADMSTAAISPPASAPDAP